MSIAQDTEICYDLLQEHLDEFKVQANSRDLVNVIGGYVGEGYGKCTEDDLRKLYSWLKSMNSLCITKLISALTLISFQNLVYQPSSIYPRIYLISFIPYQSKLALCPISNGPSSQFTAMLCSIL